MAFIPGLNPPSPMEEALRKLQLAILDRNAKGIQGAAKNAQLGMRKFGKDAMNLPGRMPGGTGPTGLASTDSQGYAQLLQERERFLRIQKMLQGQ